MKSPAYLWASELLAQFIEGSTDAFLILTGGSALAQSSTVNLPAITPRQLLISVALGGAIYAASFLKKYPLPSKMPQPSGTAANPLP